MDMDMMWILKDRGWKGWSWRMIGKVRAGAWDHILSARFAIIKGSLAMEVIGRYYIYVIF